MPWSETTKIRERMRFVLDAEGKLFTMMELCEHHGMEDHSDADAITCTLRLKAPLAWIWDLRKRGASPVSPWDPARSPPPRSASA